MKRKTILILIVAIVIINMAYVGIASAIKTKANTEGKSNPVTFKNTYGIWKLSYIEAGAETEGSLCLVEPKGKTLIYYKIILDEYIYFRNVKGEKYSISESTGSEEYIYKFNEDTIELYNFKTGEVEKTIDFAAIAEENAPGKQFNYWDVISAKDIDGKRYLGWRVYPIEDPYNYEQSEAITYDLEEEKVVDYINVKPSSKYTEEEKEYYKSFYIIADRRCNFLEINGIPRDSVDVDGVGITYTDSWQNGIIEVEMPASLLPKNNTRLYTEFPKLKEYNVNAGDRVKFFFAGYPDAEEIMEMLIEEGTELTYEGCVMSRGSTIDGKEHEISNMDDYIEWRDWGKVSRYME